jgi:hypothetical protein
MDSCGSFAEFVPNYRNKEGEACERRIRTMRKVFLLAGVSLIAALATQPTRADETSEPPLAQVQAQVQVQPEMQGPVVIEEGPAGVVGDPGCSASGVTCPRLKKFCEWLTYQPLNRPCKACKRTAYPCCHVHPYALFPCEAYIPPPVVPTTTCAVATPGCAACAAHP